MSKANKQKLQKDQNEKQTEKQTMILWISAGVLMMALLFARVIYPEMLWLSVVLVLPILGVLGTLVVQNQKALKSRTAAYGLNSVVTVVLVLGIVGVLNFITSRYPLKWDLTKNKIHTLSDQSSKLIKTLPKPVKATFYAKLSQKDQIRPLSGLTFQSARTGNNSGENSAPFRFKSTATIARPPFSR